jgi:uncharacterized membrane protein (UPF0182 family)
MTLPGEDKLEYVSLRTFVPVSQDNAKQELTGFMAAKPDGSLVVYNTPQDVPGPSLVSSSILSNQEISREVTLLGQQGSRVEFGNLLPVPITKPGDSQNGPIPGSLLYVLPLYVSATGETQVPKLTEVVVSYKQQIVKAPTVQEALVQILAGANAGTGTPAQTPSPGSTTTTTPGTTTTTVPGATTTVPSGPVNVQDLAKRAAAAFDAADAALKNGDLGTYKAKTDEAKSLVQQIANQPAAAPSSTTSSAPGTTAAPPPSTTSTTARPAGA